ncbi:hypothetical protein PSCICF_48360 [Pseudomonas cichorii]|nr:hypothetical protein PSCICF_48360 [Pseudomonas cichorii]
MTICAKPGTKLLQTILAKPWHFTIGCVCNRAAKPGTASPYFFKRLTDLQPWMVQQDALRKPIGLNYTRPDGRTLAKQGRRRFTWGVAPYVGHNHLRNRL